MKSTHIATYFKLANEFIEIVNSDIERAKQLEEFGFSDIDALHIALAERSNSDYFITCDDDIIRCYKNHRNLLKVHIVGLTEFIGLEVT